MGGCVSSPASPGGEVSERDRALHRQAEKALKEAKAKMAVQVKVRLYSLGWTDELILVCAVGV